MITAITIAIVLLGVFGGYAYWAVGAIAAGATWWPYAAGLLLLPLAIPFVASVAWFALAAWFGSPPPPDARLDLRQRLALFWGEMCAIARSGPRMVLYRWLVPDPPPAPAALPVLLLHGVLCNAGVWLGLRRHLRDRGLGPVYTLSYGPPLASIELFAQQLAAKIDAILRDTGARQVALVGHSMGGLVARAYLRRFGADRVRLLMTLGTPHHGSVHAYLFPGASLAQLRPGNRWLATLNGDPLPPLRLVALWSPHDSMVAPQSSARLDGAAEIVVRGVGHNALLGDPAVYAAVERELIAAGATPAVPARADAA
ncbi:MAG: alpha/beta fold hydrolase [Betaproteobacteria bacterium]|nr:alpha/beta fold hydrolase [Betaproteobacteria bacterium]